MKPAKRSAGRSSRTACRPVRPASRRSAPATPPAARGAPVARVFRHTLRVRYSECDPQGVVFNANYVAYFDVIITELWREALGRYSDLLEHDADMVVGEVNVRFLGPAGFDDELDFEARLTRVGETAISTRIDVTTGGKPVVEGRMRHVFIQPDTKAKRAMPEHVRDALLLYLDEDAE